MVTHCNKCNSSSLKLNGTRINKDGTVTQRYKCKVCFSGFSGQVRSEQEYEPELVEAESSFKKNIFVITSCQNNAAVNESFARSLHRYCQIRNAQLLVVPIVYKANAHDTLVYNIPEDVEHQLVTQKVKIHPEVYVMGSFNFIPTAVNPLSGLESLSKGDTLIVPSPQLRMKSMAVSATRHPAILHTTGAVSHPEYTNTKVGEKAKFNHSYSALVVEIDSDGDFHIRVLSANGDGSFFDLGKQYSHDSNEVKPVEVASLVTGDEHAVYADMSVLLATYLGQDSIVRTLKPAYVVRHDVLDMYSGSHHHRNNSIKTVGKRIFGLDSVQDELDITVDYLELTGSTGDFVSIIVPSNHNDHLTKWLSEVNIKHEPWNAKFYHKMMYHVLESLVKTDSGVSHANPFEIYCGWRGLKNVRFLAPGESFKVERVEMGAHGHEGQNGSRGSLNQYSNLSGKYIIGHSHTPGIISGAYQVGTSSMLNLEYVSGPSSWLQCHCLVYANGKRQLVNIVNGKWHG
jgi:hypothetical protein